MRASQFQFEHRSAPPLFVHRWAPAGEPRARLLVVHGMAEHGGRYAGLGEALSRDGIEVLAPDLPGHGRTAGPQDLGHFADHDGWRRVLDAVHDLRVAMQAKGGKVFLFGHSMGSFIAQHYLVAHGAGLAGAVLSGTTGDMGPLRRIGLALLSVEARLRGPRHRSALAEALTFKTYARRFAPARTPFDWLSRDPEAVDRYIADPLCGFRCSTATWLELLRAGAVLGDPQRLARIPPQLPILLIAGEHDPVSGGGAGPRILERGYRRAGLQDVTLRVWPEARHELLHDVCRSEVLQLLRDWLGNHCERTGS